MTKSELVAAMAAGAGMSKADAARALQAMTDAITKTLSKGGTVTLTGFGTFKVNKRKARKGVNPRTGEPLSIPAMNAASFKVGKGLRDAVR